MTFNPPDISVLPIVTPELSPEPITYHNIAFLPIAGLTGQSTNGLFIGNVLRGILIDGRITQDETVRQED